MYSSIIFMRFMTSFSIKLTAPSDIQHKQFPSFIHNFKGPLCVSISDSPSLSAILSTIRLYTCQQPLISWLAFSSIYYRPRRQALLIFSLIYGETVSKVNGQKYIRHPHVMTIQHRKMNQWFICIFARKLRIHTLSIHSVIL